ncbi:MAG: YbhB/YbcL family Raf kinase inhibitor-like protein [Coxiellaceae bacterium]|nr:YbhB/YbcL family Raf kinase inhibitor-like protein [Coxiellaceae bacterium]
MIKTLTVLTYLFGGAETHQPPMELLSKALASNGKIPIKYTCHGRNVSIPLAWRHIPAGTRSLALVMYQKDGVTKHRYLWAVYNIPPERQWITPAAKLLRGEHYAENSDGHLDYDGPCPSEGKQQHYVIELYALKARFYFHKNVATPTLLKAMEHRVIAKAKLDLYYNGSTSKHHLR